jgi:hypothetical protein
MKMMIIINQIKHLKQIRKMEENQKMHGFQVMMMKMDQVKKKFKKIETTKCQTSEDGEKNSDDDNDDGKNLLINQ